MSLNDNLGLGHVGNASTGGSQTLGRGGEKAERLNFSKEQTLVVFR